MRIRQLEQVQQRFSLQQQRVSEVQKLITETQEQLKQQYARPSEEIVDPIISQQQFRYIQYLQSQLVHFRRTLKREEYTLEKIRLEMQQAHIQKKSLELLEEKQRRNYIQTLEKQESNELEDIVLARRHHFKTHTF
jgi:flagellar export protein FliJ